MSQKINQKVPHCLRVMGPCEPPQQKMKEKNFHLKTPPISSLHAPCFYFYKRVRKCALKLRTFVLGKKYRIIVLLSIIQTTIIN